MFYFDPMNYSTEHPMHYLIIFWSWSWQWIPLKSAGSAVRRVAGNVPFKARSSTVILVLVDVEGQVTGFNPIVSSDWGGGVYCWLRSKMEWCAGGIYCFCWQQSIFWIAQRAIFCVHGQAVKKLTRLTRIEDIQLNSNTNLYHGPRRWPITTFLHISNSLLPTAIPKANSQSAYFCHWSLWWCPKSNLQELCLKIHEMLKMAWMKNIKL